MGRHTAARGFTRTALLAPILAALLVACSPGRASSPTTGASSASPTAAPGPVAAAASFGPEQVPIPVGSALGPVKTAVYPATIDGVPCETAEQLVYHIHAHLSVFVDGQPRQVPFGIGIAPPIQVIDSALGAAAVGGSCFYWLHTHAADGVIHVESPTQALYTLGQFFDVWGQSLAADQVGAASGPLTVFVDGQPYAGSPRDIPLVAHRQIQLDVWTPVVPPGSVTWPPDL